MLIINDLHIGHRRSGGTTPASREALRSWLLSRVTSLVNSTEENHTLVLGDLFDDFQVDTRDLLAAYNIFSNWLSGNVGARLTLVAGNHDTSPKAEKVSSFRALCDFLSSAYPGAVQVVDIDEVAEPAPGVLCVAHCANQDRFDLALREAHAKCKAAGCTHLLLHANYDNGFAEESDHSLNVSQEAAETFAELGVTLVFAHEHQARTALGGRVVVLGNQIPTSVSDCLRNDQKNAHVLRDGGLVRVQAWAREDSEGGFAEVDWTDLPAPEGTGFVRVTGRAPAAQAADVVNAVAAYRQRSDAFVITSSVQVEGIPEVQDLPQAFEAAKAFDVLEFIKRHLDEAEIATVEGLLK